MDDELTRMRLDAADCLLRARAASDAAELRAAVAPLLALDAIPLPLDAQRMFVVRDLEAARTLCACWLALAESDTEGRMGRELEGALRPAERFRRLAEAIADALYRGRPLPDTVAGELARESPPVRSSARRGRWWSRFFGIRASDERAIG